MELAERQLLPGESQLVDGCRPATEPARDGFDGLGVEEGPLAGPVRSLHPGADGVAPDRVVLQLALDEGQRRFPVARTEKKWSGSL